MLLNAKEIYNSMKFDWRIFNTIVVYGVGDFGQVFLRWLELDAERVFGKTILKCVTQKENDNEEDIKEINEIAVDNSETVIVIATSEDKHEEMYKNVLKAGFEHVVMMNQRSYNAMKRELEREFYLKQSYLCANEATWALNLNRVIEELDWVERKDFTTFQSWAVDNHYLYVLCRVLDYKKPSKILDIGLGQTTKLFEQYCDYNCGCCLDVLENDEEWIDFIGEHLRKEGKIRNAKIIKLNYEIIEFKQELVRVYAGFKEKFKDMKYNLISIDAPYGGDMNMYSRIDILDILPECLEDDWIILMHDTNRVGESNTVENIKELLEIKKIKYCMQQYDFFTIIASGDNEFVCTI